MTVLAAFQKQHDHILRVAAEIRALLADPAAPDAAARHRTLLSNLSGTLSVHLAMEDGSLYPRLAQAQSPEVRAMGTRYAGEMRGLSSNFRAHVDRWSTARSIREKPDQYAAEMKRILDTLTSRIAFENAELYPALERLGG